MKEKGLNKLINSFKYAIDGIKIAIKTEQNLRIHITIMILVIIAGIILKISKIEWIICIILFGFVISLELVNTAIENTVDLITMEKNPKAKIAKDVSAAAVLVAAGMSAIVGLIIFVPKILG
jgi:diacylglycerol kinase (ATP)